jgi:hypothetical protein
VTSWSVVGNIRGPEGPQGPPGTGGGGGGYVHDQQEATTVWDIEHNLGFDPGGVHIVALNGDVWLPVTLTYPTPGQIARVTFPTSIAGTAWLS